MSESTLSPEEQISSIWDLGGLSWRELARRVWGGINQNDLFNRGYELAYNFLLAVFPLLLFLVALLGIFAAQGKLQNDLFFYLQQVLPPAAYKLVLSTLNEVTQNSGGGKLTFGLLLALFSGSGGMTQLMSTLNEAYEVREGRSWLRVHLISFGLTIAMSVLIIAALLLVLAGGQVVEVIAAAVGLSSAGLVAGKILQWVLALVCGVRLCGHLLFCPRREGAALVLDHAGFRSGSGALGDRFRGITRVPAFLQ
jgi:YihY family inner membrane protein